MLENENGFNLDENVVENEETAKIEETERQAEKPVTTVEQAEDATRYEPVNRMYDYSTPEPTFGYVDDNKKVKKARKVKVKKERKNSLLKRCLAGILIGVLFGASAGGAFYGVQKGISMFDTTNEITGTAGSISESNVSNALITQTAPLTSSNINYTTSNVTNVVENVMPSMVSIINNFTRTTTFFGQRYTEPGQASGSGFIVAAGSEELLIVTNNHVVSDCDSLEVTFADSSKAEAWIKGTDEDMDLAVIAVKMADLSAETLGAIKVANLGDSESLKLGEAVIAIGNALGYGQSVTQGIVSALNRQVENEDGIEGKFIQTDAAINPGNSGGALINLNGEVIGINSSKIASTSVEGVGYAIPISAALPILNDLMEQQTKIKLADDERGYLGITCQNVTSEYSQILGIPVGVFVADMEADSAAAQAGILQKDVIVKFDGKKISSYEDLVSTLQYYAAGTTVPITVARQEQGQYVEYTFQLTLGSRPQSNS